MRDLDYRTYLRYVSRRLYDIVEIKEALARDDYEYAAGIWYELPENEQHVLFGLAPKWGGIFTTREREQIKLPEFNQAYYGERESDPW